MSPIGSTHSPVVPIAAPFDLTDYPELAGISGISGTGLVTRIGLGSYATRTITGTTNQVNVANGSGVVGNPTLSLPQNIHTAATPTFAGITLSGMTAGSVLFASTGGVVSQDNSNLYWDDTNNRLGVGIAAPNSLLHVNGLSRFEDYLRGQTTTDTLYISSHTAISATKKLYLDTGSNTYLSEVSSDTINIVTGGSERLRINNVGNILIGTTTNTASGGLIQLATGTTAAFGILAGTDTNLYRSAANTWKTDDALTIADTTASTSSTTGALIVSGGIGVAKDSYINSIRVGLGANSVATNTALGVSALAAITTGARNVAAGYLSATSQASQSDTVAIGNEAARYLTNYGNVAIGSYAVTGTNGSATGTENVGIGYAALNVITSGYRNVAIGAYAGNKITGGISNMLIGELAGYSITTGLANCYIGSQAGAYMTGSNNTGIGYSSMFGVLGSSTGVGNTGIGYYTGIALTTGSRNTIIGYNTGIGLTSGSNNIILGANAGKYSTTQSNELIIDNQDRTNRAGDIAGALLYGTFNATPSSQTLTVNAALKPTNSATSQIVVSGWDSVGGASTQNGSIDFGTLSTAKGVIHYESSSVGKLYLDNTYDNTAGEIRLRLRTAGTAVDMATFNVAGTTFKVPTGGYIYNRVNTTDITEVSSGGLKVGSGTLTVLGGASFITTSTALTNGAGAGAGTLTNAPSAGDPTKWIGINDNGTTRYIPAW